MTIYTFTAAQSAAIVARWNELANPINQIDPSAVHLVIGENFDADIEDDGSHMVEVPSHASKTGNPASFYVYRDEVTEEG